MADSASLLSAEWINERVENVMAKVEALVSRILDEGLLSSGYLPLTSPLSDALLRRMSPDQFTALWGQQGPEEQQELVNRLVRLKVPWILRLEGGE